MSSELSPTGDAAVSGDPVSGSVVMPTSPAALERAIEERRNHLAATIDELAARTKPKEIARRSVLGVQQKLQSLTHTEDGQLRTERLAAAGGALAALAGVLVLLRRRRKRS